MTDQQIKQAISEVPGNVRFFCDNRDYIMYAINTIRERVEKAKSLYDEQCIKDIVQAERTVANIILIRMHEGFRNDVEINAYLLKTLIQDYDVAIILQNKSLMKAILEGDYLTNDRELILIMQKNQIVDHEIAEMCYKRIKKFESFSKLNGISVAISVNSDNALKYLENTTKVIDVFTHIADNNTRNDPDVFNLFLSKYRFDGTLYDNKDVYMSLNEENKEKFRTKYIEHIRECGNERIFRKEVGDMMKIMNIQLDIK